jgi:Tol biopolymer transport system component
MGKIKKIAILVIGLSIAAYIFTSVPILIFPVRMTLLDRLRWYLFTNYNIELPEFQVIPTPEINLKGKIAFTNFPVYEKGEIYIADPEKKNITLFVKDWRIVEYPGNDLSWSPDGKIVFIGPLVESKLGNTIYQIDIIGKGKITQLICFEGEFIDSLSVSPDGQYIAFTAKAGSSGRRIYILNLQIKIIKKIADYVSPCSSWSPDGKRLVIDTSEGIFIVNIADNRSTFVARWGHYPTWTPDGKIAFIRYIEDEKRISVPQIFIVNPDGSNETQLTHFSQKDFGVNFSSENPGVLEIKKLGYSPDGKKIALALEIQLTTGPIFGSPEEIRKYIRSKIYILNADGTNLVELAEGFSFTWTG